jgi:riboflavin kinase / FMN adenylyltransferase
MINTLSQKLELIEKSGIHAVVVEPFDLKFAHLPAKQWFRKILLENLHAYGVVAGYDFTFGTHRSGTIETLEELCTQHKMSCQILEAQLLGETLISSSQIRAFVLHGNMERACALLGRTFYIDGEVIKGVGRGASLGVRTANLKVDNELIPLSGVYACYAQLGRKKYKAVTNIGMNPTFGGKTLSIEVHLLHFKREIYGKQMRLHFIKRIREEQSFATAEELVKQIHTDIDTAQKIL